MELSGVLIALIASVLVGGGLVTYLSATNKNHWIKLLLAFSGGFIGDYFSALVTRFISRRR